MRNTATPHMISFVNRRHINTQKIDEAIRDILNQYNQFSFPKLWGNGKIAAADGTKYDLYEENLLSEYHIRYGVKVGKVLPSILLRKLNNYSRKNRLYQAFRELGRVVRTVFLLKYISDMRLREQISASTNKVEAYNGFSKWFFFGGDGIISENDPEEQEKRIKYNDLVSNTVIFQNIVDMTFILWDLMKEGYEFSREDLVMLSPYQTRHIKRFGDYLIDLENIPQPYQGEIPV